MKKLTEEIKMSCPIPKGATVTIVQGKLLYNNVLYNLDTPGCVLGDFNFETKAKVNEVEIENTEVKEQPKAEEKPIKKGKKSAQKPSTEDDNIEPKKEDVKPQQKDDDMSPPIQAPQDANPGQGQPVQQQQAPVQQMQPQGYPVQQPQMPVNMQLPQGYVPPQGFVIPQQYMPQQFMPQQQETHATTEHPQEGLDLNMIQKIMDMAGDNPMLLVVMVAGYLGFTWMKKLEKIKEKEAENGGAHASACDNDRKNLSSKLNDIDFKVQKVDMLENKVKQMGDVNGRLTKLEENSGGLTFNDTSELEETLARVTKKLEVLDKKVVALTQAKASEPVAVKKKVKETKSIAEMPPEDEEE
jgi:hypothetical protein